MVITSNQMLQSEKKDFIFFLYFKNFFQKEDISYI